MNKFGFSLDELESWRDQPFFLDGSNETGIVLIHGWSALPRQMKGFAEILNQQGYHVLAPLLRGHGTKPEDLEMATAEQWIEDTCFAVERLRQNPKIKKIIVGGVSMGGNLALLASLKKKMDAVLLLGTPVHFKNHLAIWAGAHLVPFFRKYLSKNYPKQVLAEKQKGTSYQYYPTASVKQCLKVVRRSVLSLNKISIPILILQTDKDYLVAKYSPWVIFNSVRSDFKKMQWIKTKDNSHVPDQDEAADSFSIALNFIEEISKK